MTGHGHVENGDLAMMLAEDGGMEHSSGFCPDHIGPGVQTANSRTAYARSVLEPSPALSAIRQDRGSRPEATRQTLQKVLFQGQVLGDWSLGRRGSALKAQEFGGLLGLEFGAWGFRT